MNKTAISTFFAAPLVVAGSVYLTPVSNVYHTNYALTSEEALIMIPVENQEYADAATSLYLDPNGFDGTTTTTVDIPEFILGMSPDETVDIDVQDLVAAVENQFNAGVVDATDPLYIFGYSQCAVVAGLAEQQLADYGIPSSDLHFVLVGDSASADGGFLSTFVDSLPAWLQQFTTDFLADFGYGDLLGLTTPDDLYPTDVYSLSADGWANWDDGANVVSMWLDHLEYLGLTPDEVSSATLSFADNLTDYISIDSADINGLSALWDGLMIAASVF